MVDLRKSINLELKLFISVFYCRVWIRYAHTNVISTELQMEPSALHSATRKDQVNIMDMNTNHIIRYSTATNHSVITPIKIIQHMCSANKASLRFNRSCFCGTVMMVNTSMWIFFFILNKLLNQCWVVLIFSENWQSLVLRNPDHIFSKDNWR